MQFHQVVAKLPRLTLDLHQSAYLANQLDRPDVIPCGAMIGAMSGTLTKPILPHSLLDNGLVRQHRIRFGLQNDSAEIILNTF